MMLVTLAAAGPRDALEEPLAQASDVMPFSLPPARYELQQARPRARATGRGRRSLISAMPLLGSFVDVVGFLHISQHAIPARP